MLELQQPGMQGLPAKPGDNGCNLRRQCIDLGVEGSTIVPIADQRMANMGQMHADLMGPPGFQIAVDKRRCRWVFPRRAESLAHLIVGHRVAGIGCIGRFDATFRAVRTGSAEGGIDGSLGGLRLAPHQRLVGAPQRPRATVIGKLVSQVSVRKVVLGDHHHAAGVLVQPVHDSRTTNAADARQRRPAMVKQTVDQSSCGIARSGMNNQPGRFDQDNEVVVFKENVERNILRPRDRVLRFRNCQCDAVSGFDAVLCFSNGFAVDGNLAAGDQSLDAHTREITVQDPGQPGVKAPAGLVAGGQLFSIVVALGKGFCHARSRPMFSGVTMTTVETNDTEEKPLDPEMEKVRRKMVRLLVVSIGVMFLGVMAVLVGVVYKVLEDGEEPAVATSTIPVAGDTPLTSTAQLPSGFEIQQVSLDGSRIMFTGRNAVGRFSVYVFDIATGQLSATVHVKQ